MSTASAADGNFEGSMQELTVNLVPKMRMPRM